MKTVIVGGGLVGSLWAVLLCKRGYEVEVYEKRPDLRNTGAGGGRSINLVITSRGLHALDQAGLIRRVFELSVPVMGRMIHSKKGEQTFQPYGRKTECNFSISRDALNAFLLDAAEAAGATLHFSHVLSELSVDKKRAKFKSQNRSVEASYQLLFGADGAGSIVRAQLAKQGYTGERTEWLEADYKELMIPAREGAGLDKNALHLWPRGTLMMMGLANKDGSFTGTLYMPKKGERSFESIKSKKDVQTLFENEFPDAIALMPHYLEDFEKNPQGGLGTVRCSKWVGPSIALMGDAAHAIVPFFGQGMNCGFEDCTTLLKLLDTSEHWEVVLEKFDHARRPNAQAIADMAIENWVEMRDKVGDPKFLLRKKVEAVLEKEFPDLYKSRYGLITYTLVPYALAQEAGRVQERLLQTLCSGLERIDDLSLAAARKILEKEFVPFLKRNQLYLQPYPFPPEIQID